LRRALAYIGIFVCSFLQNASLYRDGKGHDDEAPDRFVHISSKKNNLAYLHTPSPPRVVVVVVVHRVFHKVLGLVLSSLLPVHRDNFFVFFHRKSNFKICTANSLSHQFPQNSKLIN
jgi:hypothetical protein